jgi:hypothetical protein
MIRAATQSAAKTVGSALKYNPVCHWRNERVRGLWQRNGINYAQIKVRGWAGQVSLHGETVAGAVAARQVLNAEIKSGTFLASPELKERVLRRTATTDRPERSRFTRVERMTSVMEGRCTPPLTVVRWPPTARVSMGTLSKVHCRMKGLSIRHAQESPKALNSGFSESLSPIYSDLFAIDRGGKRLQE